MQLFDVETKEPIGVPLQLGSVDGPGLRWSPDGSSVWVVPTGGPVRVAASAIRWREIACQIVNRELTADEWNTFVGDGDPISACTD